jgi:DNA-binding transcriptional regulator LsrR (DeoR family)
MTNPSSERLDLAGDRRLDFAARAAWLYYVRGRTQEQIAIELNLSRQIVQRLIALALSENLIRFQLIHPMSECIELADKLRGRFDLHYCEVAPGEREGDEDISTVATLAALYLENMLQQKAPLTIGIGNGQAMREAAPRISPMNCPQHKLISLMGNLTRYGRASQHDVIMRLSERVGAQCYPLPMPVVTNTVEERQVLQAQLGYKTMLSLLEEASLLIMGLGYMGWQAPLHLDGFITDVELGQAMESGAIGELLGHSINIEGQLLTGGYHDRLTSYLLQAPAKRPTMIVQSGTKRVPAITAAITSKLANCLITDENTARKILGE